tara:strand:+ start:1895 stop:2668 length:774 start_codon:yes stop_codon:yes gene_type:complete
MYKRIFTFGCSFTSFIWTTWSDIIGDDLNIPVFNWGISGLGNVGIFHRMLECDLKYKFTSDDLIIVNWTSWGREDRVGDRNAWLPGGFIDKNNPYYGDEFRRQYCSENNDIVKNTTAIISANRMFNIDYQSHVVDYETGVEDGGGDLYDFTQYSYLLDALPKKILFDNSDNSRFKNTIHDKHPDVLCHLNHARRIYEDLNLTMKASTIEKYNTLQTTMVDNVLTSTMKPNKDWQHLLKFIQSSEIWQDRRQDGAEIN